MRTRTEYVSKITYFSFKILTMVLVSSWHACTIIDSCHAFVNTERSFGGGGVGGCGGGGGGGGGSGGGGGGKRK